MRIDAQIYVYNDTDQIPSHLLFTSSRIKPKLVVTNIVFNISFQRHNNNNVPKYNKP